MPVQHAYVLVPQIEHCQDQIHPNRNRKWNVSQNKSAFFLPVSQFPWLFPFPPSSSFPIYCSENGSGPDQRREKKVLGRRRKKVEHKSILLSRLKSFPGPNDIIVPGYVSSFSHFPCPIVKSFWMEPWTISFLGGKIKKCS